MRTLIFSLTAILGLLLGGCSHNNGYIGNWFGTWEVTSIYVDGEPDETYTGNMFIKFQTNVCDIIVVQPHNDYFQYYAHWKEVNDKTLIIDYGHTSEWEPERFEPPTVGYFIKGENILSVHKDGKSKLSLTQETEDGKTVVYKLKKQ